MGDYSAAFAEKFLDDVKKLDRHERELVFKRIQKILENPYSGKPLHSPLSNYRSERLDKYRIIYKIGSETVEFAWLEHRKHAYR
jgi:mRNA-degrading endonuclease RelE of RelBE toxin-antitoxin system